MVLLFLVSLISTATALVVSDCDILISGGNLGGVAAALAASDTNTSLQVCYTDITDQVVKQQREGPQP